MLVLPERGWQWHAIRHCRRKNNQMLLFMYISTDIAKREQRKIMKRGSRLDEKRNKAKPISNNSLSVVLALISLATPIPTHARRWNLHVSLFLILFYARLKRVSAIVIGVVVSPDFWLFTVLLYTVHRYKYNFASIDACIHIHLHIHTHAMHTRCKFSVT